MPSDPYSSVGAPGAPLAGGAADVYAPDPELEALPAPPRKERTATLVLMLFTAIVAAWAAFSLRGEARYAFTPGAPLEVGDLTSLHPTGDLANRYVRGSALLGTSGAIKYGRAAEGDSFRLAPVAGNPDVWVEIRVPEGFEGPRFVPPTSFAGRLVPFGSAGLRHSSLAAAVRERTHVTVPSNAWLLVDGSSPRASRWALALVLLFAGFSGWNLVAAGRLIARVRDRRVGEG